MRGGEEEGRREEREEELGIYTVLLCKPPHIYLHLFISANCYVWFFLFVLRVLAKAMSTKQFIMTF